MWKALGTDAQGAHKAEEEIRQGDDSNRDGWELIAIATWWTLGEQRMPPSRWKTQRSEMLWKILQDDTEGYIEG